MRNLHHNITYKNAEFLIREIIHEALNSQLEGVLLSENKEETDRIKTLLL